MATNDDKMVRHLSLVLYLMASSNPQTSYSVHQAVEGYAAMNEEAFSRRFYADRAELAEMGIRIEVQKSRSSECDDEVYSLSGDRFRMAAFPGGERAALLGLEETLGREYAYAAPLRLALRQLFPDAPLAPVGGTARIAVASAVPTHHPALPKIDSAILRHKALKIDYRTSEGAEPQECKIDPYQLVSRNGRLCLIGRSHELDAVRYLAVSCIDGTVTYASRAERDFDPCEGFVLAEHLAEVDACLAEAADREIDDEVSGPRIEPERLARLTTLASILIEAANGSGSVPISGVRAMLGLSHTDLHEDISILNVVNFGGGAHLLYAEVLGDRVDVGWEPYGEILGDPMRLLPLGVKAVIGAIDIVCCDGHHDQQLQDARERIVNALGKDAADYGLHVANGDTTEPDTGTASEALALAA